MKMPPFSDFIKSVDLDKLSYDLELHASSVLKDETNLFTQEQYEFLTATFATMSLTLLRQYHQWLSESTNE